MEEQTPALQPPAPAPPAPAVFPDQEGSSAPEELRRHVLAECRSMVRYVWASGLSLPDDLRRLLDALDLPHAGPDAPPLSLLSEIHECLAHVVAPAMPRTIHLLETDQASRTLLGILGPLPNIRRLMAAALGFIALFLALAQSQQINGTNLQKLFSELDGLELLIVLGFYMSAAGLGACFNALFKAHSYISRQTYDPRYDSSYWIRIALGIIAGLMLAQLIPGEQLPSGSGDKQQAATSVGLAKPLLAVLGGFSASLVHMILERLVDTVESLFRTSPKAEVAAAGREPARRREADDSPRPSFSPPPAMDDLPPPEASSPVELSSPESQPLEPASQPPPTSLEVPGQARQEVRAASLEVVGRAIRRNRMRV